MENFLKKVKHISDISEESANELLKLCRSGNFRKNEFILKKEELSHHIYFVSSGLLRIYYFKEEKEISEWFAFENNFCLSIVSYFKKTPSKLIIQCLEDSEVIFIPREEFDNLRNKNFEIAEFGYRLLSGSLIASQERMAGIQFETAVTRYEKLINQHKNFLQRVPLQYIASYLGVSAETLSRIRSQLIN